VFFAVAILAACGGGSNSKSTPQPPAPDIDVPPIIASLWQHDSFGQAAADEVRNGVFIATDYVFDDHGANLDALPGGDYAYPSDAAPYKRNAADIVELRLRADTPAKMIDIGVRLNTLLDTSTPVIAVGIDDGTAPSLDVTWPYDVGVHAPGVRYVLTIQNDTAVLTDLTSGATEEFTVTIGNDLGVAGAQRENTFTVEIPFNALARESITGDDVWHIYTVAGLWKDGVWQRTNGASPAPYDLGFITEEFINFQHNKQADILASGDISGTSAVINFQEFPDRPVNIKSGLQTRIYRSPISHIVGEGIGSWDYVINDDVLVPSGTDHYQGLYLPYTLNVPVEYVQSDDALPLFAMLHGLSGNHLSYVTPYLDGTMTYPGLTAMPTGAAGSSFYVAEGNVDVLAMIDDMERNFRVEHDRIFLAGISMGGQGVYSIATHYPDKFAAAIPIIGTGSALFHRDAPIEIISEQRFKTEKFQGSTGRELLGNAFNLPFRPINGAIDPIVNSAWVVQDTERATSSGNDFRLSLFSNRQHEVVSKHLNATFHQLLNRCASDSAPDGCEPGLETEIYQRDINPARVVYRVTPHHFFPEFNLVFNKAYWVSGLEVRQLANAGDNGTIDATSFGLADKLKGEPEAIGPEHRVFGPTSDNYLYSGQRQTAAPRPTERRMVVDLKNLARVELDLDRAGIAEISAEGLIEVVTDGSVEILLHGLIPGSRVESNNGGIKFAVENQPVATSFSGAGTYKIVLLP
jgi:dienelactone hydrolase